MKGEVNLSLMGSDENLSVGTNKTKRKLAKYITLCILIVYSVITLLPFYFIFVRSFVPTKDSAQLHMWLPRMQEFNMNSKFGGLAVYYNLDIEKFKKDFGIKGYLDSETTINEIAKQYGISPEKMKRYFTPFYIYNGWYVILSGGKFVKSLFVTIFIVSVSIILGSFLSLATGYVLARFKKHWHLVVYNIYLLQIIIPITMIMLPLYLIVSRYFNLDNSYAALILLNIQGGALPTMMFTASIAAIPVEIQESVHMDGGTRVNYFFSMIIPLSKTTIAAFAAMRIPGYWNELVNGFLFLERDKYPLIPMLNSIVGTYTTNFQAIYSGLVFSVLPLLILYMFFRKLFVESMMAGAVKG